MREPQKGAFWSAFDKLVDGMAGAAALVMVVITIAICREVVMRYFFASPSEWAIPFCEYSLLWMVFLGTTWLLRENGHVAVDVIHAHLPPKIRAGLDVVTHSLAAVAVGVMVLLGSQYTYECVLNGVTDVRAVTVPKAAVFVIIPFGSLLLLIQLLRMIACRISAFRNGEETQP